MGGTPPRWCSGDPNPLLEFFANRTMVQYPGSTRDYLGHTDAQRSPGIHLEVLGGLYGTGA